MKLKSLFNITVIISSLGYFVDIYDLILFGIVRIPSLKDIGVSGDQLISVGVMLLNMQMAGMLLGGIIWGILGDKRGRISVLFGSIFLYSVANFTNAFITDTTQYAVLRFIAGLGLAGELGVAITLVSEVMPKETRGYGTALVAGIGVSGAIFAALVGEFFNWKVAYIIGGVIGFLLLIMRVKIFESGIYKNIQKLDIAKGKFLSLFTSSNRFKRYIYCILIGLPIWYVVGILITFSPEFAEVLGYNDKIVAGRSILFTYAGLIFGDIASGFLSQIIRSRRKVIFLFVAFSALFIFIYLFLPGKSATYFYSLTFFLGLSNGYWAVMVTIASEQFGTNLRATVTTTVPNFVRGAVVPLTLGFEYLRNKAGMINSAVIIGAVTIVIAIFAAYHLSETFGKSLDYLEDI